MLFDYAERPPPVFMTQSIHILKGGTGTRAHTHALKLAMFRIGVYNGLDLTITSAFVGASNVTTGFSTRLLEIRGNRRITRADGQAELCRA